VVGVAYRVDPVFGSGERQELIAQGQVPAEIERFDKAVAASSAELEAVVTRVAEQVGQAEAAIFRGHLGIIRDQVLLARVRELIATKSVTALSALQVVLQEYAARFAAIENDMFRERLTDIRDVVSKIGAHLTLDPCIAPTPRGADGEPLILVTHELLPSQAINIENLTIAGIVTEVGGGTSHAAILARSRGIPAVSGVVGISGRVQTGDVIVVDGRDGLVAVRPDTETLTAYRKMQRDFLNIRNRLVRNRDKAAVSADGAQVEILANINNLADAETAVAVGASGVGLFRTEYLFLTHQDVPDEEEQYQHYKQVIEASPSQTVVIRTLDLGGDKTVPYLGRRHEANPFMGWRSIRLSFEHPKMFERQIRAILRAGQHGRQVSMLFPMITTLEELRHVNRLVHETRTSLRRDNVPFGENVKTGVMIEVPAAAVCIDAILRETDFISIGSNDLIQYLVAADRDNPKVAHLCEPLSPAIFRVLQMIFDACRRTGTPVTVCGEMAGQPRSVLALFGMGLRRFSMSPAFVPTVKELLASVTTAQAERFAHQVLQLKTSDEIRSYLTNRLHEVSSDIEVFDFG
jgi:phosphoenolpyruvate-protein phosphotransferase